MKSYVVVVFGASGSGKSTLMEALQKSGSQYSIHVKVTTRAPRQYDGVEIRCAEEDEVTRSDYVYQTYGYSYGIQRSQIDDAQKQGQHHFIVCNDISVIRALKRDYGDLVRVVFHVFDAPRQAIETIQRERGIGDDEIQLRLIKIDALIRTYSENYNLFDAVLVNHFGDSPDHLRGQMEKILARFVTSAPSDRAVLGELAERVLARLPKKDTASATQPNYAFVMMAMSTADPSIVDVHEAIKRACGSIGIVAERGDDSEFTGPITQKILGSIRISEFVIADLTHERPNVYYEVGYADALGKSVILVAREGTNVHFDLQGMKILYYPNLHHLEEKLKRVIGALKATQQASLDA